jgi:hypothetical protein
MGGTLSLFLARLNRTQDIAGLRDLRQVNLRLGLGLMPDGGWSFGSALQKHTNPLSLIFFEGAGVGLRFRNTNILQNIEDLSAFDLKLTRQVIDSYLTHPPLFSPSASLR